MKLHLQLVNFILKQVYGRGLETKLQVILPFTTRITKLQKNRSDIRLAQREVSKDSETYCRSSVSPSLHSEVRDSQPRLHRPSVRFQ